MILTVTINPLLERRFLYNKVQFGRENRNGLEKFSAGGKGINVSRQLNCLNTDNTALTFLGGVNGKIFRNIVLSEGIKTVSVKIQNETREAVVVFDDSEKQVTTFFNSNTQITLTEADELICKLEKMIKVCEIVVFSGSSSCKETDNIFPAGIEAANKYDKISVCDTYGSHLKACLEKAPTVLHNNTSETEKSLNISLETEKDKIDYLSYLYGRGIKQSYLTNGELPGYASNSDFHFKFTAPEIKAVDSTGSGDGFVAGLIYGIHNGLSFKDGLAIASSIGALNAARQDVCNINKDEIDEFKDSVIIVPVGKKMKTQ